MNVVLLQISGGNYHLLGALHQQAGEPDGIRRVLAVSLDELLGRNFDPQIDDAITVVTENDLDQILADIVHVALHGGQNDLAARGAFGLLHECFEVTDRGFHGFGRLQHFRDNQLVVVEQAADFSHALHERAIDDVEWRGAFGALAVQICDQALFRAFDNVAGQALVERQISG